MDWIKKITGVIASLLCSQMPEQRLPCSPMSSGHQRTTSESILLGSSSNFDHTIPEDNGLQNCNLIGDQTYNVVPSRDTNLWSIHGGLRYRYMKVNSRCLFVL